MFSLSNTAARRVCHSPQKLAAKRPFGYRVNEPVSPLGTDLRSLYEHAAREHVHGRNAGSGGFFSFDSDKRPSAVWVISEATEVPAGQTAPQHDGKSASGWVFTRVSGSSVPCVYDTESRIETDSTSDKK